MRRATSRDTVSNIVAMPRPPRTAEDVAKPSPDIVTRLAGATRSKSVTKDSLNVMPSAVKKTHGHILRATCTT